MKRLSLTLITTCLLLISVVAAQEEKSSEVLFPEAQKEFGEKSPKLVAACFLFHIEMKRWPSSKEELREWESEKKAPVVDWEQARGIEFEMGADEKFVVFMRDSTGVPRVGQWMRFKKDQDRTHPESDLEMDMVFTVNAYKHLKQKQEPNQPPQTTPVSAPR